MATLFCTTALELQAAYDTCVAGDEIVLDHTATFEGNFVVRNRGVIPDTNRIIVRSDTAASLLPAAGYRIFPVWSPWLAKIEPLQNNTVQFVTGTLFAAGANGYTFQNIEFLPSLFGSGVVVEIGSNDATQVEYAHIPYNITFDRCYIHGHPLSGQKGGLRSCGDNVKLLNCWIEDIKGFGQDAWALGVVNCRGPLEVTNCYLSGAGFSFITGGTDPRIKTVATVLASPAPTTTEATLSTLKDLSLGQHIAILYTDGATLKREFTTVSAINTTTNRVTYAAVTAAPDVPGNIAWGVQFRGLIFRRNHCVKQVRWMTPILETPVPITPVVTPQGTGLAVGTYYYTLQGIHDQIGYQQNRYYSATAGEQTVVVGQTSHVTTSWAAVPDTTRFRVHRYQKDGGGNRINARYYETTSLTFTDVNNVGSAFTTFVGASNWTEKNIFELKLGVDCQVDSNIFEYHWISPAADGYCIWLKNNNQKDTADGHVFSQCRDIRIEKNIFRHVAGFVSISDARATGELPRDLPEHMYDVVVRNNLGHDSSNVWSTNPPIWNYATQSTGGAKRTKWRHNTFIHFGAGAAQLGTNSATQGYQEDQEWTDNIFLQQTYGWFSNIVPPSVSTQHKAAIDAITNNTATFNRNIVADGVAAYNTFPAQTNYMPTLAALANEFKNYDNGINGDYRLKRIAEGDAFDSAYLNAGTDGADIGCDIPLVLAATAGVIEGLPEGTVVVPSGAVEPRLRHTRLRRWSAR